MEADGVQWREPGPGSLSSHLPRSVAWCRNHWGAEPEVCTLHFDFEKAFRKTVVHCIQFAAQWCVPLRVLGVATCRWLVGS